MMPSGCHGGLGIHQNKRVMALPWPPFALRAQEGAMRPTCLLGLPLRWKSSVSLGLEESPWLTHGWRSQMGQSPGQGGDDEVTWYLVPPPCTGELGSGMEWGKEAEFSFFLTRSGRALAPSGVSGSMHCCVCMCSSPGYACARPPMGTGTHGPAADHADRFVCCCVPRARAVRGAKQVLITRLSDGH